MSSHHIVREKQEPALLVLGMDDFPAEMLGQLLEWSPTVIVTGKTAEKIDANGIKIDWLIANEMDAGMQPEVKLMPQGSDTSAEAALKYLIAHNYPAVNIITDVLELKEYEFFADKINLVVFHEGNKVYSVSSGFSKWKPEGELIRLLSDPGKLKVSGLKNIGGDQYQTTHDGFFSLQFKQPFLFIAEEI